MINQNHMNFSIWIPLEDSNINTGSLCQFKKDKLRLNFPFEGQNLLSISRYINSYKEIDPFIKDSINPKFCEAGSYLYWTPYVLHGATKPISKARISINYQVFNISTTPLLLKNAEDFAIWLFSEYPVIFCFCMLIGYGDIKGAKSLRNNKFEIEYSKLSKTSKKHGILFFNFVKDKLSHIKNISLRPSTSKVHWSKDYSWIRELFNLYD